MDCLKIGELIKDIRIEKNMTQKQLANKLNVTDKAISKWERGLGCPDISLIEELSSILNININTILHGELEVNKKDGGNMKRTTFYICEVCNNLITASNSADLSCCGRKLKQLIPQKAEASHKIKMAEVENDYYITFDHEMTKAHYISFIACVMDGGVLIIKLYPEQNPEVRIPKMFKNKFYYYCSKDGLWVD